MFIAIIGTRFSGKSTVEEYLISKGFTLLRLLQANGQPAEDNKWVFRPRAGSNPYLRSHDYASKHASFLSMTPLASPITAASSYSDLTQPIYFFNTTEILNHVTENWREHFVTCDLTTRDLLHPFVRRPFFLILQTDAPVLERYRRSKTIADLSLEDFVEDNDRIVYGTAAGDPQASTRSNSLQSLADIVSIHVTNSFNRIPDLHKYLDRLNLLDPEHLRPSWDSYFMTLASLASRRSNCMKRRVGALLVRGNRVLATGYNGTPRGLTNCRDGGCSHCNYTSKSNLISNECLCLHAEENALLEAGRDRVGVDCVLYCNTCPCLKCTVKIIQTGVKTVVYNLAYKVDDASSRLFKEAGVELRRFDPNSKLHLLPTPAEDETFTLPPSDPDVEADAAQ